MSILHAIISDVGGKGVCIWPRTSRRPASDGQIIPFAFAFYEASPEPQTCSNGSSALHTVQAGSSPPPMPEQRKPGLLVVAPCRVDLELTGGRRSGFHRVCSVRPTNLIQWLACIAHGVGRIKSAADAGTAQTRIARRATLSCRSGFDWRTPLRLSSGLLGPAYKPVKSSHARLRFTKRLPSNSPTAPIASDPMLVGSGTACRKPRISPPGKAVVWMFK